MVFYKSRLQTPGQNKVSPGVLSSDDSHGSLRRAAFAGSTATIAQPGLKFSIAPSQKILYRLPPLSAFQATCRISPITHPVLFPAAAAAENGETGGKHSE